MILEAAILDVIPGTEVAFEEASRQASPLIAATTGYRGHTLGRCHEAPSRYLLLVWWDRLEDHTIGFRGSPQYLEWKRLLHHFYRSMPTVEHYIEVLASPSP